MDVFFSDSDYLRFLRAVRYYKLEVPVKFSQHNIGINQKRPTDGKRQLVDILAYCLMPNHFHFLLKQKIDSGIQKFIQKLSNSNAHYVNQKYDRVGPLFQGRFKTVLVEDLEQLIHLSRYIHLNPVSASFCKLPTDYKWSSLNEYLDPQADKLCDFDQVLDHFDSIESYKKFVTDQIEYAKELGRIKHLTIEEI